MVFWVEKLIGHILKALNKSKKQKKVCVVASLPHFGDKNVKMKLTIVISSSKSVCAFISWRQNHSESLEALERPEVP